MAFSLCLNTQVSRVSYVISIAVFSFAPAVGSVIGIILTSVGGSEADEGGVANDLVIQVLQAM